MSEMKVVYRFTRYDINMDEQPVTPRYATLETIARVQGDAIRDSLRPVKAEYVDVDGFYCGPPLDDQGS